jgi:hypothetical protein
MATTYYENIQKLYVAYFNRPADTAGLAYWEGVVEAAKGDTAAVSAAFAADTEYKAAYKDLSNADIVNKVYQNLFGRDAEAAGKAYWADLLDKKTITIDAVVTAIASGAQDTDLTAYNNKVKAATAFTAALDTATEQKGYSGDAANAVAKTFISGVTTDASLAAAIAPATLGATVAKSVAAGTAFSLASGLEALTVANAAKAAFLDAADGKVDGKVADGTEAKIGTDVTAKLGALDAVVAGDYAGSSAGVRAVLLSSQQALNAAALADAQAAVNTANANIAKVAGLKDAISTLDAAKTAVTGAQNAEKSAAVDLAAKLGAYNAQNSTALTNADIAANGSITGVVTYNTETKALELASGVTEAKNPGVTALLTSLTAHESAEAGVTAAVTTQTSAQKAVDVLDLTDAAKADLKDIATALKLAAGATPTEAQITTQLAQLDAVKKSTADIAAADPTNTTKAAAATDAAAAYKTFNDLVTKYHTDDNANPLVKALTDSTKVVTDDQKVITDLAKAVADLDAANATQAQLTAVNSQVQAAKDAFTSHDLLQPVTFNATTTSALATAAADIYVVDAKTSTGATITNFGLLGSDALYIGTGYTLNTGDITKAGNDAVLEAFIVKTDTGTNVVLETKPFSSNSSDAEITITLTGVDATKVHLTNGIITVS